MFLRVVSRSIASNEVHLTRNLDQGKYIKYYLSMTAAQKEWELGGLQFGRSDGYGFLTVPAKVNLNNTKDRLVWVFNSPPDYAGTVLATAEVLNTFLQLGSATPEAILDFARSWGLLRLCKHGLPATHSHSPYGSVYFGEDSAYVLERYPYCRPLGTSALDDNQGYEPISDWRQISRMAKALIDIVAKLNQDELGREDDWNVLYERSTMNRIGQNIVQQRLDCVSVVNTWLRVADLKPQLVYDWNPFDHEWKSMKVADTPRLREGTHIRFETDHFRGSSLFAHLACQLMTIALGHGVAVCSACGKMYGPRKRKPKHGQNNYCGKCGVKAARRDASSRYRARRRKE